MGLYINTSKPAKQRYGLNNLDEKLEKHPDYDGRFFVELGANNGVHQLNSFTMKNLKMARYSY